MNTAQAESILSNIPDTLPEELITVLASSPSIRIERIVSRGHTSDEGFWYDQDQHEWVCVVAGRARLEFEDGCIDLEPGSYIMIEAHRRHRVAWTDPDVATIWLAIFF